MAPENDTPWRQSDEWREISRRQALRNLAAIHQAPICGAKAKSTGKPCRKPGLGKGGRCALHGGRSGSGETWGRRQWRDSPSPVVTRRQIAKAKNVEIAEAERAERLVAMSPEERRRYDTWLRAHAPGSQAGRAAAKLLSALGAPKTAPAGQGMSIVEMQTRLNELKAEKRAWEAHCAIEERLGVFE
jgi:hypothetical protein